MSTKIFCYCDICGDEIDYSFSETHHVSRIFLGATEQTLDICERCWKAMVKWIGFNKRSVDNAKS